MNLIRKIILKLDDWRFNIYFFFKTGQRTPSQDKLSCLAKKYPPPDDYWSDKYD